MALKAIHFFFAAFNLGLYRTAVAKKRELAMAKQKEQNIKGQK
jgi:hypothetical protein